MSWHATPRPASLVHPTLGAHCPATLSLCSTLRAAPHPVALGDSHLYRGTKLNRTLTVLHDDARSKRHDRYPGRSFEIPRDGCDVPALVTRRLDPLKLQRRASRNSVSPPWTYYTRPALEQLQTDNREFYRREFILSFLIASIRYAACLSRCNRDTPIRFGRKSDTVRRCWLKTSRDDVLLLAIYGPARRRQESFEETLSNKRVATRPGERNETRLLSTRTRASASTTLDGRAISPSGETQRGKHKARRKLPVRYQVERRREEGGLRARARGKVAGSVNQPKCLGIELWHPRGQQCLTTNYACRARRGTSSYTYVSLKNRGVAGAERSPGEPDYCPLECSNTNRRLRRARTIFRFCARKCPWKYR